ncbi:MAG: hypothetical protein DRR08_30300 [Candidatus Parabeggiatoa sp. nov. 2]|nr:MAG: hypothetical protein DRR08_30300 [Gammaproteobacteria bacterium]
MQNELREKKFPKITSTFIYNSTHNIMSTPMLYPLEKSYFSASYSTFVQATNHWENLFEWFTKKALALAIHNPLSVLSVGSGTGILDKRLIPLFQSQVSQIRYVGIDPSEPRCAIFEEHAKALRSENVSISIQATQFESYETDQQFYLVLMVHALYHFPSPEIPILTSYNLLTQKGKGVIVIAPPDNEFSLFPCKLYPSTREYQPCVNPTVESILCEKKSLMKIFLSRHKLT